MFGKFIPVPRLEAIYGDEGCSYFYSSSVLLEPLPWTDPLAKLRDRIELNLASTLRSPLAIAIASVNTQSVGTRITKRAWAPVPRSLRFHWRYPQV
ncbi:hypothetical protein JOY44_30870 (plasmid) [Phormidium sp. CLA17]|uniref:hypothetical protein n=1 Tax=Leptolyngbya sp. Cla-17 TaxID=2803751 RepID=UPI001931F880|nr:hypothetical protein [Leptolyngbya sp. Cla-17]MBM0745781.1 hypothetical protein [Leptolyngbya sp. Cla-17]